MNFNYKASRQQSSLETEEILQKLKYPDTVLDDLCSLARIVAKADSAYAMLISGDDLIVIAQSAGMPIGVCRRFSSIALRIDVDPALVRSTCGKNCKGGCTFPRNMFSGNRAFAPIRGIHGAVGVLMLGMDNPQETISVAGTAYMEKVAGLISTRLWMGPKTTAPRVELMAQLTATPLT